MSKHCKVHLEVRWLGDITYIHVLYKDFSGALCLIGRLIKVKWKRHLLHYEACVASIKSNHISKQSHWFSLFETMVEILAAAWTCYRCRAGANGLMDDLRSTSFLSECDGPPRSTVPGRVYSFPLLKLHHTINTNTHGGSSQYFVKLNLFFASSQKNNTKQSFPLQRLVSKKFTSHELFS